MMEKKYQVFVSSTYKDLIMERKRVMESLLQMNCFPVGMEYFNAADESQWEIIRELINECDYYVLIIAGEYGTIDEQEHKSYTQKEYEYALQQKIPTIAFVRKDLETVESQFVESDEEKRKMLNDFTDMVKKKLCKFWGTPDELASQVVLSLTSLIKSKPRTGWIRADELPAIADKTILKLKDTTEQLKVENEQLKQQIRVNEDNNPKDIEKLQHGEDKIKLKVEYYVSHTAFSNQILLTWNQIISFVAPYLINECSEQNMKNGLCDSIKVLLTEQGSSKVELLSIEDSSFQTIKVQLIALHIIELSDKRHSAKDQNTTYWKLTKYGYQQMMLLKALKRK